MYRLLLFIAFLTTANISYSQDFNFAPQQKLFDHPIEGLFEFPFIPVDVDYDGKTEYIGRGENQDLVVYENIAGNYTPELFMNDEIFARPFEIMDFNEDGYDDIIMTNYILLFNPLENNYSTLTYEDNNGYVPSIVGIADFDNNGFNDLVTIYDAGSLSTDLSIQYYDGTTFNTFAIPDTLINPGPIRIGDLEGDGDIDIILVDKSQSDSPKIMVNDGAGDFETRAVQGNVILKSRTIDFADFDNDNDLDILCIDKDGTLKIYENSDNFLTPPTSWLAEFAVNALSSQVVDLDDDGVLEIITLQHVGATFTLNIHSSRGGLNYQDKQTIGTIQGSDFFLTLNPNFLKNIIRYADTDFDGDMDIVLTFGIGDDPAVWFYENGSSSNKTTSTQNIQELSALSVYPNPCNQFINIAELNNTPKSYNYRILSIMGQEVLQGETAKTIDVSNLKNGQYLLSIRDVETTWNKIIIVQNKF